MNKAVFFAAALLLTPVPALCQGTQQQPQDRDSSYSDRDTNAGSDSERDSRREDLLERLSKSDLRERLASAVDRIEGACANDIERFCSDITPGGGRIASCVRAYSDQLSRRCRFTLRIAARKVRNAVEGIADTCMKGIQEQCGNTDKVGPCLQQKMTALPHPCQTIIAAVHEARQAMARGAEEQGQGAEEQEAQGPQEQEEQGQTAQAQGTEGQRSQTAEAQGLQGQGSQRMGSLRGMPVFSSDGKDLGQIINVQRSPDGKIQSVQIQIGRMLGLGEKVITIDGSKLEQLADRVRVMMSSDQVRSLPEVKKSGT